MSDCPNISSQVRVYSPKLSIKIVLICSMEKENIFDETSSNDPKLQKTAVFFTFIILFSAETSPRVLSIN